MRHIYLYASFGPPICPEPVQQLAQIDQIDRSKCRSAAGQKPKLIRSCDIGERSRDRAKATIFANVDNSVLAPMPPPADQVELTTRMRMKRVRDAHRAPGRIHTTCSR